MLSIERRRADPADSDGEKVRHRGRAFQNHVCQRRYDSPDLSQMEKEGLIKRSHGGAVLFGVNQRRDLYPHAGTGNIKQKKIIAEIALKFIKIMTTYLWIPVLRRNHNPAFRKL